MSNIKYIIVCCLTFLTIAVFAQEPVSHVVAKGESIASIAKKYNVTEEAIIEENPVLKNFIYVGMKIRIPNAKNETVSLTEVQAETPAESHVETPVEETVVEKKSETSVITTPKNYTQSSVIERQPDSFTPHKQYAGLAFCLPTLEGLSDSFFAWGIDLTGFGYQFFLSPNFFLDASGHIGFRHSNTKLSDEWQQRTNEFAFHFPVMVGVEVSGFQLRAGGFLEYTVIGWTASKVGNETTRTLYSNMKSNAPNRFHYGARFDASFGFVDVGFLLYWQSGVKTSTKALAIGFKF